MGQFRTESWELRFMYNIKGIEPSSFFSMEAPISSTENFRQPIAVYCGSNPGKNAAFAYAASCTTLH